MSERSEGYRKTSVKPCGYTSWPQTREMLPHRAHWLVLMEPRPHNDARIAMQPGRAYEAAKDFGAARTNCFKAADPRATARQATQDHGAERDVRRSPGHFTNVRSGFPFSTI